MLSERKGVLWVCALIVGVGALLSLALSMRLLLGSPTSPSLQRIVMSLFVLSIFAWAPPVWLAVEYIRATRETDTWRERMSGLNGTEVLALTRHCPASLKTLALGGAIFGLVQSFRIGGVTATGDQVLTGTELMGFLAGSAVFFCLGFPVITSAALMRGSYDD
jgi:hypothetical protein